MIPALLFLLVVGSAVGFGYAFPGYSYPLAFWALVVVLGSCWLWTTTQVVREGETSRESFLLTVTGTFAAFAVTTILYVEDALLLSLLGPASMSLSLFYFFLFGYHLVNLPDGLEYRFRRLLFRRGI